MVGCRRIIPGILGMGSLDLDLLSLGFHFEGSECDLQYTVVIDGNCAVDIHLMGKCDGLVELPRLGA